MKITFIVFKDGDKFSLFRKMIRLYGEIWLRMCILKLVRRGSVALKIIEVLISLFTIKD